VGVVCLMFFSSGHAQTPPMPMQPNQYRPTVPAQGKQQTPPIGIDISPNLPQVPTTAPSMHSPNNQTPPVPVLEDLQNTQDLQGRRASTPKAVELETCSPFYNSAYFEISDMLDGTIPLSIKRAVFLQEWAYLDGNLDYKDYCRGIDSTVYSIRRFILANNLQKYKTGSNLALFEYFVRPYGMNGYKPITYDLEDFSDENDFTKLFVTKVMRTHSGQCRSLPMYYKVLAEALGAEAHITLAPEHYFIRHRDEQDSSKFVNVELTTQGFSRDAFYIETFGITEEAIRNKVYMHPLSDRETVALLLSELAGAYYLKYRTNDYFVWFCLNKSLEYYPTNIMALIQKANVIDNFLGEYVARNGGQVDSYALSLDEQWHGTWDKIRSLGWTEISNENYDRLLKGVEKSMREEGMDEQKIKAETEKVRQTNMKNNKPN